MCNISSSWSGWLATCWWRTCNFLCIQDQTRGFVAFKVNGVIIRTLNIQHAALTVLLTLNQLRLHKLPDKQYIHIHTAPQQAFTLLLVRRFICGDKREWTAVQQCVSVSTRTWWGTGVLKWLPDGASIININLRSLLSCTFSIQLIMLI